MKYLLLVILLSGCRDTSDEFAFAAQQCDRRMSLAHSWQDTLRVLRYRPLELDGQHYYDACARVFSDRDAHAQFVQRESLRIVHPKPSLLP